MAALLALVEPPVGIDPDFAAASPGGAGQLYDPKHVWASVLERSRAARRLVEGLFGGKGQLALDGTRYYLAMLAEQLVYDSADAQVCETLYLSRPVLPP